MAGQLPARGELDQDRRASWWESTPADDAGICCLPQHTQTTVSVKSGDNPSLRARALICEGFCRSTRASAMTRLGRRARSTEGVETAITMHIPFRENTGIRMYRQPRRHRFSSAATEAPSLPPAAYLAPILAMLTPLRNPSSTDSEAQANVHHVHSLLPPGHGSHSSANVPARGRNRFMYSRCRSTSSNIRASSHPATTAATRAAAAIASNPASAA